MATKMRSATEESIRGTVINYVGVGVGFLATFFVLTRYLTAEEVGLTRLLVEMTTMLAAMGALGLNSSLPRFFPYFRDSEELGDKGRVPHHGFFFWILLISIVGASLVSLAYGLFHNTMTRMMSQDNALFFRYYGIIIPTTIALVLWTSFELYTLQFQRLAVPKAIREVLFRSLFLLIYVLFALGWIDLDGVVIGIVSVYLLCTVASYLYLSSVTRLSLSYERGYVTPQLKRSFLRFSALEIGVAIGNILIDRIDIFLIAIFPGGGLGNVAVYSIAFYIVAIVEIPTRAIMSMINPQMAQAMKGGDLVRAKALGHKASFYNALSAGIIFLVVWLNIDNVFSILPNGGDYVEGKWVVCYLGIARLIDLVLCPNSVLLAYSRHYHWNFVSTTLKLCVAVAVKLCLMSHYGPTEAALSTLVIVFSSYALLQVVAWWRLRFVAFSGRLLVLVPLFVLVYVVGCYSPHICSPWLDMMARGGGVVLLIGGLCWWLNLVPELRSWVLYK